MLHSDHIDGTVGNQECSNRRGRLRGACEGEVVLRWSHDFGTPVRYAMIDRSEGGLRIITGIPLSEGMTGVVSRYLPGGTAVNQPVMVAWTASSPDDGGYHCGLWFFGTP